MHPPVYPTAVDQPRDHHCHVRSPAQGPRPEFFGSQSGAVHHELVRRTVVRRGGLQRPHVAPVSELRLGITPDCLVVQRAVQPVFLLLLVAERPDVGHEHDPVERRGKVLAHGVHDPLVLLLCHAELALELHHADHAAEGAHVEFRAGRVRVVGLVEYSGRIRDDRGFDLATAGGGGRGAPVEEVGYAFRGERRGGAFPREVGVRRRTTTRRHVRLSDRYC
mmetsp:Transcript_26257/g.52328  ORF Transcript_26257/g.52328 Transcript_26257/m.52328 type:complete len:221 (+) Transcript_26257:1635-2297(+)